MDKCELRNSEVATLIPVEQLPRRVYMLTDRQTLCCRFPLSPTDCYSLQQLFVDTSEIAIAHDEHVIAGMAGGHDGCD